MENWTDATVHANGIDIHYLRTGGTKPQVVLSHGLSDNGACWSLLAQELSRDYDLIMPDARGHGRSSVPEHGYTSDDRTADLIGLIESLGLDRPALIGHSMGGETSALVAAQAPELVRGAILEDPAFWSQSMAVREPAPGEWAKGLLADQAMSVEELVQKGRANSPTWDTRVFDIWARAKHEASVKIYDWVAGPRADWQSYVKKIGVPTLIVTGEPERGAIISPGMMAELRAENPRISEAHVAGAGHCIRYEQPEKFLAIAREFLGKLF